MICLERRRTERSRRGFALMLLDASELLAANSREDSLDAILAALTESTRDTDIQGWYEDNSVIGVIFTEIGEGDVRMAASGIRTKVSNALGRHLTQLELNQISISFHIFPDDWDGGNSEEALRVYLRDRKARRLSLVLKRAMDIVGSILTLVLAFPVLAMIAAAIKLTSKGPVLFRQERVGQYGKTFTFLKFRSMRANNDPTIHQEYVKRFIAGKNTTAENGDKPAVYKITADPRVTPIGRFLRSTSLDELPQFFNVLSGEMSLVGPRPPVPYEFQCYDIWHRRRMLETKPGITGLWQVEGRSKVSFDDMVRLDIRYARSWSLWLDVKILLRTPKAVFLGAY
jgi:exopolysaccharide biosynthesis polyprenyl glycosylphosphotransferase